MIGFILLVLCVLFSALASIFLKMGVSALTQPSNFLSVITSPMIWFGGGFYSIAFLGYIYVLKIVPLSLVQPVITAGVSVFTTVVAVIFFKEQLMLLNWFGLLIVCIGIFFIFYGRI